MRRRVCKAAPRAENRALRRGVPPAITPKVLDFHDDCQARVQRVPFGGTEIPIISAEDLAVCKAAFDREKDWADLREMIAIQGERFDRAYVLRWLDRLLGPDDRRTIQFRCLLESGAPGPAGTTGSRS